MAHDISLYLLSAMFPAISMSMDIAVPIINRLSSGWSFLRGAMPGARGFAGFSAYGSRPFL
jgi:hypothetical protein